MSAPTLLQLLAKHTTIDLDSNDASIAPLYPAGTFTDMTSNQAIVYGDILKKENLHLIHEAAIEAQALVEAQAAGAKGRDIASVTVDIITIKLALPILPHLSGFVHSQTSPSAARSLPRTLAHAHSLIALYTHYSISPSRLCLKIPATAAGILACRQLEKEGQATLATIVCCEKQARAGGGLTYIAPYINPLEVHFVEGTWRDEGAHGLEGYRVAAEAQKGFEAKGLKTKVMAASLATPTEALCLAGLFHSTISPAILALLASTPSTPADEALIKQSVAFYANATPSTAAPAAEEDPTAFLPAGCDAKAEALTENALRIFGEFEMKLLEAARVELGRIGEGGD